MRLRLVLLTLLVASGFYQMIQEYDQAANPSFQHLFDRPDYEFDSITFRQPGLLNEPALTWKVDQVHEIDQLLRFLQNYQYQKVDPSSLQLFDDEPIFTIYLQDTAGNSITILIEEELIIENETLYYQIVDGPLNVDWLMDFVFSNKP